MSIGSGTGPTTNVSGCFLWFKADTSTGLNTSGSYIYYLQDLSGSGNNMTPAASSNAPAFYPNIINGYPVVRFSGVNYLQTTANPSVTCSNNNLACFTVLSITGADNQVILSNSQSTPLPLGIMGYTVAVSSDYPIFRTQAIPQITSPSAIINNQFVLLGHWFDNNSNLYIDYFWNTLASGNMSLTGRSYPDYLGFCPANGFPNGYLQGDIAELAAWDVPLGTGDVQTIKQYFVNKYFSPAVSYTGPISSISDCFLWYESSSLSGLPAGNPVQYWQDLSGSGNHLVPFNGSGSTPWVYPNQINGYPTVRFSGSQGLTTAIPNGSTLNTTDNLSIFTVFSTSASGFQVICSADSGVTEPKISFILELNAGNSLQFEDASSQISYTSGLPVNKFILRNDHFDPDSGQYILSYFGQDLVSGINSVTTIQDPGFNVGFAPFYGITGNNLQGDIAEIVAYQKPLSASETSLVNQYLLNKYFGPSGSGGGGSGITPPFHNPSDLSGLFGWYRSTSIGITGVDGSPVQYWPDDSGSGNNLAVGNSGTWIFPTFQRNQFNIYPSVRFNNAGNTSYLSTNAGNQSMHFSDGDFTGFAVFKTSDTTDSQSIYSIDAPLASSVSPCLSVEINDNSYTNSFAFANSSGVRIGGTAYDYLYGSSTNLGTNLYSANTTVIRHDRFKQSNGQFVFGLYGADLSSGTAHTSFNLQNSLQIGISLNKSNPFLGDIAEIVLYRRKLSGAETDLVNTYLINKYLPPNVGTTTLFINSTTNSSIYTDIPLYMVGVNSGIFNSTTLYIGSTLLNNSGVTLYEVSIGSTTGSIPLYTESNSSINNNITLYTESTSIASGYTTLYTSGFYIQNPSFTGIFPLYTAGSYQQYPPLILYTTSNFAMTGSIPLYTKLSSQFTNNTTLYISGANVTVSSYIPFYMTNFTSTGVSHLGLYISGTTNPSLNHHINLFLANTNSPGSNASGLYNSKQLYIEAGKLNTSLPLYISTTTASTEINPTGKLPLFIGDPFASGYYNNSVSLFLSNGATQLDSITKRLYIKGLGSLIGGQFLQSNGLDLFLYNNQSIPIISSGFAGYFSSQYVDSNYFRSDYFALDGNTPVGATLISRGMPLYIGSSSEDPSGIPLYTTSFSQSQINVVPGYFWKNYMTSAYFQIDYFDLLEGGGINMSQSGIPLFIGGSGTASITNDFTIYTRGF